MIFPICNAQRYACIKRRTQGQQFDFTWYFSLFLFKIVSKFSRPIWISIPCHMIALWISVTYSPKVKTQAIISDISLPTTQLNHWPVQTFTLEFNYGTVLNDTPRPLPRILSAGYKPASFPTSCFFERHRILIRSSPGFPTIEFYENTCE